MIYIIDFVEDFYMVEMSGIEPESKSSLQSASIHASLHLKNFEDGARCKKPHPLVSKILITLLRRKGLSKPSIKMKSISDRWPSTERLSSPKGN